MRRISVPFKLSAVMALAACALFAALGLLCSSAYGNVQSSGDETDGPTPLVTGSVDGLTTMATASKSTVYNVGSGSCTCDDPDTEYTIVGASSDGATVTIKGGTAQSPIRVILDNVTINQDSVRPSSAPITVESGQALIMLRGTNVLKAGYKHLVFSHNWGFAGLCVQKGAVCVITSADGDGSTNGLLEAHGGHDKYGGAGIGTNYDDDTGSIYINGGTIRAYGAHCAAGIGSGRDGECYTTCIQGGDVWAWGGEYAAGIGGGDAVGVSTGGTTHDLWIHGGTVHAYGGDNGGAGIGGSEGGGTDKITITGGNITAYGCGENGSKGSAAGIGSGDGKVCGTIKIDQGSGELTINAKGCGEGAGIGGANCQSGTIDIKLRGGAITATGGPEAAGIGSGDDESGTINIKGNGTINAQAGWQSAAIGAGDQGHSGPININGNSSRLNINAYAPKPQNQGENFVSHAAIIGAGDGSASDISINNANINLYGSSGATILGAGIGTGSSNDLSMSDKGIGSITISNAQISFHSIFKMYGAGIGAGYGSNIKSITLDNVDYEGPTIGSSCSDRFGTSENNMDSISISNSNIKATARGDDNRNHAGIGTGPYGTIKSITISNSNVEARGVHGAAGIGSGGMYVNPGQVLHLASSDGKCGSVTITGSGTVKAIGNEGGAGIGSGTLTSVYGDITISKGATVEAVGGDDSGAGIGGGKLCSCANITIDGATVTATGGPAAAGIGTGGVDDTTFISGVIQTTWNTICGNITITGASNVTAMGGDGAAGIGLGQGAQMESNSGITISGGTVNATGGARGAGIGAGRESGLGRGAEARRIRIEGESKVTALGGAGAAGIGGGYEGGVEQCHISLSVNDPRYAYVIAHGGVGAAGIGAGASSRQSTSKGTMDGAHDAKHLSFSGGFVAAYGGDGLESSEEGRTGAGAGIGGGSYQGDLEGCLISGGVVVAQGGAKAAGAPTGYIDAEDIGHGGSRSGGGDGSDGIYIQGGTVVGKVNEREPVLVSGGSVTHRFAFDKATRSNFEFKPVYQNAIAIDTKPLVPFEFEKKLFYKLGLESTSADYFHGDDAFAIAEGEDRTKNRAKAYLYLPAGEANATTAFVKPADAVLSYYGTTTAGQYPNYAQDTNVLKMGAPIAIAPKRRSDKLVEGQPYIVRVGDLDGALGDTDTACYTSATNAEYNGYRMANDTMNTDVSHVPIYTNYATSGRTYTDVTVTPGSAGQTMRLTARLNGTSEASDLYWGNGEAVFEKEIEVAPLYVKITNRDALTKLYDGKPAANVAYDTNGTITKIRCLGQLGTPYDKTVTSPNVPYMPTDIGCYEVTIWAERNGKQVTDSATFKIVDPNSPKEPTSLTISDPSKVYDTQPVNPTVQCTSDGKVELSYKKQDGTALDGPPTDAGDYILTASVPMTVTYEAASATSQFSIMPKPATLALSASGNGGTGVATATARLSDVFGDVVGSAVEITLDGEVATAKLAANGDGAFTATSTFNGAAPGLHRASARYANPNYLTVGATCPFLIRKCPVVLTIDVSDKVYDGQPATATATARTEDGEELDQQITLSYYVRQDDGTFGNMLESAPVDTGSYWVVAETAGDDHYQSARAEAGFSIIKPIPYVRITNADKLSKVYDGDPVIDVKYDTNVTEYDTDAANASTAIKYVGWKATAYGTTEPYGPTASKPTQIGNYSVTVEVQLFGQKASDTAVFAISEDTNQKKKPYLAVDVPPKTYDTQAVDPIVWCMSDGEVSLSYRTQNGPALNSAPKDAGTYILTASVAATERYESATCERTFTIEPKVGVLTLAARAGDREGRADISIALSDVYEDVVGSKVSVELGGKTAEATIRESEGAFMATCSIDGIEPGSYTVRASFSKENYTVADASTEFVMPEQDPDVRVIIVEDPTKYYDGNPVADPKVVKTPNTPDTEVSYAYSLGSTPMEPGERPKEPGVYLVTATAELNDVSASDTLLFLIRKCPVVLTIDVSDKVYDGQPAIVSVTAKAEGGSPVDQAQKIELSYYKEQDDGTFDDKLALPPVDAGNYRVTATSSGSSRYRAAEASASFSIIDKPVPFLYVDMPDRFVYDAQAVDYPVVWNYSGGDAEITYYDAKGTVLDKEPKDAGSYSVEVSTLETAKYRAVSSGKIPFTILPRPAVLAISAVGDQSTESAEVAVTLKGALSDVVGKFIGIDVAYDEPDAVSTQSMDGTSLATQAAANVQAQIKSVDGSLVATHKFPHVGAGEYMVTASYSDDSNYLVKDEEERFDKSMRAYRVSAEDKTVTFGDAPFAVKAEVRDSNGAEVANPKLSYSQVSSKDLPMVDEDSAVLGEGGMVSVRKAGISAIRVDVAGDDTHDGDYDYAVITVEKAPLALTVTAKDKVADGKPAEVAYSIDDAAYPVPYSGDVTLTYFRENAGVRTQLEAAPTESGSYVVVATATADSNFNAAVAEASFKIQASSDSGNNSGGSSTPRTGDNAVIWPLVVFAAFGFVASAYSACRMRARKQRDDGKGQTG